jgi:hypothetical protein
MADEPLVECRVGVIGESAFLGCDNANPQRKQIRIRRIGSVAGKRDIVAAGPALHVVPKGVHLHRVLCQPGVVLLNQDFPPIEGSPSPGNPAATNK